MNFNWGLTNFLTLTIIIIVVIIIIIIIIMQPLFSESYIIVVLLKFSFSCDYSDHCRFYSFRRISIFPLEFSLLLMAILLHWKWCVELVYRGEFRRGSWRHGCRQRLQPVWSISPSTDQWARDPAWCRRQSCSQLAIQVIFTCLTCGNSVDPKQGCSQEFDLGGYKY